MSAKNSPRGAGSEPERLSRSVQPTPTPRAGFLTRLRCMLGGHEWTGMQFQPMAYIRCRRCGWLP